MKMRQPTKIITALAMLASASAALAGQSPWLDRDNPSGTGDWETTATLVTSVECQVIATGQSTAGMPGYKCGVDGSICTNTAAVACQDTQVRYTFNDMRGHSATTSWLDRDDPSGTGDWETTALALTVECKFTDNNGAVTTGGAYRCSSPDVRSGGSAVNAQNAGQIVRNIAVRYSW